MSAPKNKFMFSWDSDIKSPLTELKRPVADAIMLLAPENINILRDEYESLCFNISNETYFFSEMMPRQINISISVLECLWSLSYGCSYLFNRHFNGKSITLNMPYTLEAKTAKNLLSWGIGKVFKEHSFGWPVELPKPISNPEKGSFNDLVNQSFYTAESFVIHRRLIVHRLKKNGCLYDIERQADARAVESFLKGVNENSEEFTIRATGIALGLHLLTMCAIFGRPDGETPRSTDSADRWYSALKNYIHDPNHVVWAYMVVALKSHCDNFKFNPPETNAPTLLEQFEKYASVFAQKNSWCYDDNDISTN